MARKVQLAEPACRIGSAFSIRWVSRSMLLVTNGRGGSSIAFIAAHTSACRSLRSDIWTAAPETARRLTRRLHRIWHTTDKGGATMMPTRPKASARAMSRTTRQNGIIPSAVEKPWLDPYSQGNQDDERIESRKQAKLNTGQQPHQKHWNDRQDCPNHGYQACQSASQPQKCWVWGSEHPVTKA